MNLHGINSSSGVAVELVNGGRDELLEQRIADLIAIAARSEGRRCDELTVIISADELLRGLNRDYLGVDEPTDVLAFDVSDEGSTVVSGDIYVSMDRVRAQAALQNEDDIQPELFRLIIHGFLHLCGYDHSDEVSLRTMMGRGEKYVYQLYNET